MDTRTRNKRKFRGKPTFDFVSPRSLEECVYLLQKQAGKPHWFILKIGSPTWILYIESQRVDNDTYNFKLKWKEPERPGRITLTVAYVTAQGYLKRWENNYTYVTGQDTTSIFSLFQLIYLFALVLLALGMITSRTSVPDLMFLTFLGIMEISLFLTLRKLRKELITSIKNSLYDGELVNIKRKSA